MTLLGNGGFLKDIKHALQISDWFGALPFQWNDELDQLELKSEKKRFYFKCRLVLGILYYILAMIQVFCVIGNASLLVITHSVLNMTTGVVVLSGQIMNWIHLPGVVDLFNSFIQLERNFVGSNAQPKSKSTSKKRTLQCMIYMLISTGIFVPLTYHLDVLRNPCFPVYVGFWMSSQCLPDKPGHYLEPTWSPMEILAKFGISLGSFLNWGFLIPGILLDAALEYVIEGNCFRVYTSEFGR